MDRLKRLFERDKMGDEMAKEKEKKKLLFQATGDALPAAKTPWGAVLRLPVDVTVQPGGFRVIDLNIKCTSPLAVVPTSGMTGLTDEPFRVAMPGEPIRLSIKNSFKEPVTLSARTPVIYVMPIGGEFDVETEGA